MTLSPSGSISLEKTRRRLSQFLRLSVGGRSPYLPFRAAVSITGESVGQVLVWKPVCWGQRCTHAHVPGSCSGHVPPARSAHDTARNLG